MHILFLADNFPPEKNAQASRVYERACYWIQWGHRVTVITCAPNFPEGKLYEGYENRIRQVEIMSGIRVVRVKTFIAPNAGTAMRILDFVSYMVAAIAVGLFEDTPTLLVATSPQFFTAVAGWLLSIVRRVPFVFELSDLWPDSIVAVGAMKKNLALRFVEKMELFLYRHSDIVVALTRSFKDNLVRRGIPPNKVAVVINGVDLTRYEPRPKDTDLAAHLGIGEKDFIVGYIGTHGMAHALTNVLNAAELVTDTTARFLFVGAGAERESLILDARRRNLPNVIFVPSQPKDLMPSFWSLCDVALVHLKNSVVFETVIPSKIFEAMGMGLPLLLASPKGEAERIVLGEDVGLWVPAEDPQALAEAVKRLCGDPGLLQRLKRNSFAAAPAYSREKQARDMICVLDGVAPHS